MMYADCTKNMLVKPVWFFTCKVNRKIDLLSWFCDCTQGDIDELCKNVL